MDNWIEAARPKTLVAGIVPVIVGTAAAHTIELWKFLGALAVSVSLQLAVNFANDYFDATKGVDSVDREGPRRMVSSGLISANRMRLASFIALAVAAANGLLLASEVGWVILIPGGLAIVAALAYSGGPKPFGGSALGELFVFIFFGVVATVGSAYVQIQEITSLALAASVPVGMLASAILLVNNLRDVETDYRAGKVTLVAVLGKEGSRTVFSLLVGLALFDLVALALIADSAWPLIALGAIPLSVRAMRLVLLRGDVRSLVKALAFTARTEMVFGLLLTAGLWLAGS
ncbi:MAG TPA: 1,4-dihydroxy-2-naphthoate polyprenyltransferase [Actinomycetota bacterium]|nr:1,4-dihydroxy-2-naphthoate polyprenyltransferase [Actinomycetota bacterium]